MINKRFEYKIYGRTRGRSKKKIDLNGYYRNLHKLNFSNLNKDDNNILDIGSGYGESTIFFSKKFDQYKIFSCEKYIDGNINLIRNIKLNKINNISIYNISAYEFLDRLENNKYFNFVSILFPDPWPKKKHQKRRLINDDFLKKIHSFLKDNGKIYIATDSKDYLIQILKTIYNCRSFYCLFNQHHLYLDYKNYDFPHTKYYKKAINSGKKPFLAILKKI